MIKPILIPTDKSNYSLIKDTSDRIETTGKLHLPSPHGSKVEYYNIILIDTEAEIVESDLYYDEFTGVIILANENSDHNHYKGHCHKIISSIQLLINYYNEHKCMPESVDVEKPDYNSWMANGASPVSCKLNQQGEVDITIPEESSIESTLNAFSEASDKLINNAGVEEKLYTEKEVIELLDSFQNDLTMLGEIQGYNTKIWFNTKKK